MNKQLEKIRNEVEKRTFEKQGFSSELEEYGFRACAREILFLIDSLPQEPVSKNLEETALKVYPKNIGYSTISDQMYDYNARDRRIWIAGAQWQKEQMMKDAIKGLVVCDHLTHGYKDIVMSIPDCLNVGDKVKVIIVKEE